jgi:hypothetical protein
MTEILEHIEAAISEVTKARESLLRVKSRQVAGADERRRLKEVAFLWVKRHRDHLVGLDVGAVDEAYQRVLDATSRLAARSTYSIAFKDAKTALVAVRRLVTTGARAGTNGHPSPPPPPAFDALTPDSTMQKILVRRWNEVEKCIAGEANLAATVMMGGLMETLLLARIKLVANKASIFTAKNAPKDKAGKTLTLDEWKLVAMVEVAHELDWITKSSKDVGNVLRDFRNYIHPHKEHADRLTIAPDDVRMFWEVCKTISHQILRSVV